MESIDNEFSQVVAGAADVGEKFLGVILDQTSKAGLGINLKPSQVDDTNKKYALRGAIPQPAGGSPVALRVYANRVGTSTALTVGWEVVSTDLNAPTDMGRLSNTGFGQFVAQKEARKGNTQARKDANPQRARAIRDAVQGFHAIVFVPVLQQLVDALAPAQGAGFLGA